MCEEGKNRLKPTKVPLPLHTNTFPLMSDDTYFIKSFIMTHYVRLAIFKEFLTLNMLDIAETQFESMMMNKKTRVAEICFAKYSQ